MQTIMSSNVTKKLWNGKIPACFELASHEVCSHAPPGAFYIMLPRSSYLTLFREQIQDHFQSHVDLNKVDEIWFEFREKPLRWHYPCGLLHDLYSNIAIDLPWQITVHFQNFPDDTLFRCPNDKAVESHFMSMLKEADQLKHKGQVISNMNQYQHEQLWHGLKMDNYDEFWTINKKFMEGFEGSLTYKHIPIRIYHKGQVIQKLLSARLGDAELTLCGALSSSVPMLFENESLKESTSVLIQGISPPLGTPLQWLSENLSYADNFLHICIFTS